VFWLRQKYMRDSSDGWLHSKVFVTLNNEVENRAAVIPPVNGYDASIIEIKFWFEWKIVGVQSLLQ
jgi:hypothetical protein